MRRLAYGLFVLALGCGDDGDGPVGETGASTTVVATETGETGSATDPTTDVGSTGSDGTTAADSSSTADEPQILPMCAPANDQAMCESTFGCVWDHTPGKCVVACDIIEDEAVCTDHDDCEWDGQACGGMPD